MSAKHTSGPWRWEFNAKHKSMHLVGGKPMYDLTVMDFDRWGMNGAVVRLREDVNGMNIMHRLCDRPEWVKPFPDREHHASWCAEVDHPDMRLIAAAPCLLEAIQSLLGLLEQVSIESGICCCGDDMKTHASPMLCGHSAVDSGEYYGHMAIVEAQKAIAKATGEKA